MRVHAQINAKIAKRTARRSKKKERAAREAEEAARLAKEEELRAINEKILEDQQKLQEEQEAAEGDHPSSPSGASDPNSPDFVRPRLGNADLVAWQNKMLRERAEREAMRR